VGQGSQTVTFTSAAPSEAVVGGATYNVTATGGASGNPVVFASGSSSVCTVSDSSVSFVGAGTCTVTANQAGNANYAAAAQVSQSFAVISNVPPIVIPITSPKPRIVITSGALVVNRLGHFVPVKVICDSAACSGSIRLTEVGTRRATGTKALAKRTNIVLARGSYKLAKGKSETIDLKLTPNGRSALASTVRKPIHATLAVTVGNGTTAKRNVIVR